MNSFFVIVFFLYISLVQAKTTHDDVIQQLSTSPLARATGTKDEVIHELSTSPLARATATKDAVIKELTTRIWKGIVYKRQMAAKHSALHASMVPTSRIRDEKREKADEEGELKKEITEALVKLLSAELQKNTNMLKKRNVENTLHTTVESKDENLSIRKTGSKTILSREKINGPPEIWGRDELIGPPGLWGKKEENSAETEYRYRKSSRGPPGLWGRGILFPKQTVSDAGPPGLWGKDVINDGRREEENGPPGLWGREAAKEVRERMGRTNNDNSDNKAKEVRVRKERTNNDILDYKEKEGNV